MGRSMKGVGWANASWNFISGCTIASTGCLNCYAARLALMSLQHGNSNYYSGLVREVNGRAVFTGEIKQDNEKLDLPLRWQKPSIIFVNAMSDFFHPGVSDYTRLVALQTMMKAYWHSYIILTKRADVLTDWTYSKDVQDAIRGKDVKHISLGVSIENMDTARKRLPFLVKASDKFMRCVSYEPAIEYVEITGWLSSGIDWVTAGGETGPQSRCPDPHFFRSIRNQCYLTNTEFIFNQWGDWVPAVQFAGLPEIREPQFQTLASGERMVKVGKHGAGRLLDGRYYDSDINAPRHTVQQTSDLFS